MISLMLAIAQARADDTPSKTPEASQDICMVLAHYDFEKTVNALTTFRADVFGKNPERWTVDDVKNLLANVSACDGKPLNVLLTFRVSAGNWKRALNDYRVRNFLEISNRSTQLGDEYQKAWPTSMKMPFCADLLKWKRDPVWFTNNAEDLFGGSFYQLNDADGNIVTKYVQACSPVLIEILKARQLDPKIADKFVNDITESIKRDQSAAIWNNVKLVPEFELKKDEKPIPLAYLSKPTRDIVIKLNAAITNNVLLDTDSLGQISTWIGDMNRANVKGPDQLYVEAIKSVVSNQLFKQESKYDQK